MAKTKDLTLKQIAKIAVPILKRNGVTKAGIFGSYAKGKAKKRSDIDILVKTKKNVSLFDFAGIKIELEENLHKKVDLVEYHLIKPLIKDSILKSEVRII
ncbi:MAG TPA: nucleotidyltransferase family protein [Candidatus Nanoarchaeia archaeon]|nr:nucleotidyltransferase family protein [Candidatus Nanoarchaeia archaeon]